MSEEERDSRGTPSHVDPISGTPFLSAASVGKEEADKLTDVHADPSAGMDGGAELMMQANPTQAPSQEDELLETNCSRGNEQTQGGDGAWPSGFCHAPHVTVVSHCRKEFDLAEIGV